MAQALLLSLRVKVMGRPLMGRAKGPNWTPLSDLEVDHLYLVARWWQRTSISSLASSLPGHEWVPFPNGMNVLGLGATCSESRTKTQSDNDQSNQRNRRRLVKEDVMMLTSNREGSNFSGEGKWSGLWWMFRNRGSTFQPLGIRYPARRRASRGELRV